MAYMVGIFCDGPGCKNDAGIWSDFTVNKTTATRRARALGWQVGKHGWLCPKCRRTRKEASNGEKNSKGAGSA